MKQYEQAILENFKHNTLIQYISTFKLNPIDELSDLIACLSDLHNSADIDIIEALKGYSEKEQQIQKYKLSHILELLLKQIKAEAVVIMDLLIQLDSQSEHRDLLHLFSVFCLNNPDKIDTSINQIIMNPEKYIKFMTTSLVCGASLNFEKYHEKAYELSFSENIEIKNRAIESLGRIDYKNNSDEIFKSLDRIAITLSEFNDPNIFRSSLFCVISMSQHNYMSYKLVFEIIEQISTLDKENFFDNLSNSLFSNKDVIPEEVLKYCLSRCTIIPIESCKNLELFDLTLYELSNKGRESLAIEHLAKALLQNEHISLTQFDHMIHFFIDNCKMPSVILNWFLTHKNKLCNSAGKIFDHFDFNDKELTFENDLLKDTPQEELIYLARKAIGYMYFKPIACISYILNILKYCDKETTNEILKITYNPLLISFPSKIKSFLENTVVDQNKELYKHMIDLIDHFTSQIKSTDHINEFHPSTYQKEIFNRYQQEQFSESYSKHEDQSLFSAIATKSVILYGNKSVYYLNNGADTHRQEVPMQSFETTLEYPFLPIIDPQGFDYKMRVFRLEGTSK
jgi:hypothetical protein